MSVSSKASNATSISVKYHGNDVDLLHAIDDIFHNVQDNLNHLHPFVRCLASVLEREDGDYHSLLDDQFLLLERLDEINNYFLDLKKVVKQCIKPETEDDKVYLRIKTKQYKENKKKPREVDDTELLRKMERLDLSQVVEPSLDSLEHIPE